MVSYLLYKTLKLATKVIVSPVTGPYAGTKGVFESIRNEADAERLDEDRIMQRLTDLQLQLDMGEIEQEEYDRREREIMDHLAAVRMYKRELEGKGSAVDPGEAGREKGE